MECLLAIDIGNTNIATGTFRNEHLISKSKIPTDEHSLYRKYLMLKSKDAQRIVISSVVPEALSHLTKILKKIVRCEITVVGRDVKIPIKNLYKKKSEVGQDRLVNAYAAKSIYGAPAVVIDFGTAITFDIVSKKGEYLGGLILPGIEMGLSSLYKNTALLPKVELRQARHIIGKDTVNSMRGGILFGYGAMCDGLIARYEEVLGRHLKVIATGGNANLIKKYSKSIRVADEDLTLKGLYLASLK